MRSGGDAFSAPVHGTDAVDVDHAARDIGEQLGRVEAPERFLRNEQRLPDDRGGVLHFLEPLGGRRPQPHRGERRLDRVRRPILAEAGGPWAALLGLFLLPVMVTAAPIYAGAVWGNWYPLKVTGDVVVPGGGHGTEALRYYVAVFLLASPCVPFLLLADRVGRAQMTASRMLVYTIASAALAVSVAAIFVVLVQATRHGAM